MPNDVALYFGGACFDGVSASAEIGVGPEPCVDGVPIPGHELAVGTQNFLRDLLQALIEFTPEKFLDRPLRARNARGGDAAERAHLVEAHDFNFRAALRQLLPNDRILGGGAAAALDAARELDEACDVALENEMQARAVGAALVHQRAHSHIPAVIHFAQNIASRDVHVAKEQLDKFRFTGHLAEGTNFDARRSHVHEENGEAFVFGGAGVGANDEFTPIAHPPIAGPDFLSVHDKVIAVETRFGLQTGKIRTGVRLREALAPDLFSAQNCWDITFFLGF